MESLCDELYYGKISGIEIQPDRTKEYLTASQEASDALNALRVTLSQEPAGAAGPGHKQAVGGEYDPHEADVLERDILRHPADVGDLHGCPA